MNYYKYLISLVGHKAKKEHPLLYTVKAIRSNEQKNCL